MFRWEDPKNPTEYKDYSFDWSNDLGANDSIQSASAEFVDEDGGLTIEDDATVADPLSFVWLSGGTVGQTVKIRGTIITSGGRTFTDIGLLTIAEEVDPATAALDDLRADLARLKSARLELVTTGGVKEVWRDGRRLVYNVASVADIERVIKAYEGYIEDALAASGTTNGRHRALSVRFG